MANLPYNRLSKSGQVILNVLAVLTILLLFYLHFLDRGPVHWVAERVADRNGMYSVTLAFSLAFLPFLLAEWAIVFLVDRLASRYKNPGSS